MTLDGILNIVRQWLNDKAPNAKFSIEDINHFLDRTNISLFKKFLGTTDDYQLGVPATRFGVDLTKQNTEALRKFKVYEPDFTVAGTGRLTLPSNFKHLVSLRYFWLNPATSTLKGREVELLTEQEIGDRLDNSITPPTTKHPVCWMENTYIQFKPDNLSVVDLTYYRAPATPILAVIVANDVNTYNSGGSTQLEWDEQYHQDFVDEMIRLISISINNHIPKTE